MNDPYSRQPVYDPNQYDQSQQFGFDFDFPSNSQYASYASQQTAPPSLYTPSTMGHEPLSADPFASSSDDPYANEPPLLEELGINFDQITQKTLAVVNPFRTTDAAILYDSDLAGPLVFCLAFGCFLLLSGKVSFGYIYGIGVLGCLSIYVLLNLMAPPQKTLSLSCTISVLGYSLLPMVILAGTSVLITLKTAAFGTALSLIIVGWCALSASKLFVTALSMQNQQPLVFYPCGLLFGVFALLTVF